MTFVPSTTTRTVTGDVDPKDGCNATRDERFASIPYPALSPRRLLSSPLVRVTGAMARWTQVKSPSPPDLYPRVTHLTMSGSGGIRRHCEDGPIH
jgi:hypothetical protein